MVRKEEEEERYFLTGYDSMFTFCFLLGGELLVRLWF